MNYLQTETYVDTTSVSKTLDEFKTMSEEYVPPNYESKGLTITDIIKETNAYAVGEC